MINIFSYFKAINLANHFIYCSETKFSHDLS